MKHLITFNISIVTLALLCLVANFISTGLAIGVMLGIGFLGACLSLYILCK